jgi:hypothetical protein
MHEMQAALAAAASFRMSEDDDSAKSPKDNGYQDGMRELDRESDTVRKMLGGDRGTRRRAELRNSRRVVEEIGRFWDVMVIESGPGLLTQAGPGGPPGPLGPATPTHFPLTLREI